MADAMQGLMIGIEKTIKQCTRVVAQPPQITLFLL
jgi:hypothetical protein